MSIIKARRPHFAQVVDFLTSRWFIKGAFFAFFVFASVQLLRFEAWTRGEGPYVQRPEAVAGILPVGHFTSFFLWLKGGGWDTLLPAGLVIILMSIAVSLIFKRALCGWICPVGTLWEAAAALGRKLMGGHNIRTPKWIDAVGRGLRIAITVLAFTWLASVSIGEATWFREFPYMWIADIKIIRGFIEPLFLGAIAFAFVLSLFFGPLWCRWVCPVGGLYSLFGAASVCTVCRDEDNCIHCSKCTNVCHANIDVEHAGDVRNLECDGCMECVRACPVEDCLEPRALRRYVFPTWVWPVGVLVVWLGIWAVAKFTGNWDTGLSPDMFKMAVQQGFLDASSMSF